jgi:predicted RNA-binding protein YlqC (UPF0109 family)
LSYGTTNPYFGSSRLGGSGWLKTWAQAQDALVRNASFSHSTEEIQFSTLRNSGFIGTYENNKKFYSANAGVTVGQGGSMGVELDHMDLGTMTFSGIFSPGFGNGDTNLYIFVGNNPINAYDPLGLFLWTGLSVGEFFGAAGSGAAQGLYSATVGATIESVQQGQEYMAQGFQNIADGNYVEGALQITAAVGKAAEVTLEVATAGAGKAIGATGRTVAAVDKGMDAASSARTTARAADAATDTATNARRQTGSYTNHHESGNRYHGKGTQERSNTSGRRIEGETGDKHVATEWKPSANERGAFKDEAKRIRADGGVDNPNNYNKRNSPGEKYLIEDGDL